MKIYRNIGILQLDQSTDDRILDIHKIENCGMIICKQSQSDLIDKIRLSNIGSKMALESDPCNSIVTNDALLLKKGHFATDFICLANGEVTIDGNVTSEEMSAFKGGIVNGNVYVPEHLELDFAKKTTINGNLYTYPQGAILLKKHCVIDDFFFYDFEAQSHIAVKSLDLTGTFSKETFEKTFEKVTVLQKLLIPESLIPWFKNFSDAFHEIPKKIIIPDGFQYYSSFTLDDTALKAMNGHNLYVEKNLRIEVPYEIAHQAINKVFCKSCTLDFTDKENWSNHLIAKPVFKDIHEKCIDNYSVLVITNALLQEDDALIINNYGSLTFEENIEPSLVLERIKNFSNYGSIVCSPELHALLLKLVNNYGVIRTTSQKPLATSNPFDEDASFTIIENMPHVIV